MSNRGRTLKSASEAGDLSVMKRHLAIGAKINARTANGHFPLGGAVENQHFYAVKLLIASGANVNLKSNFGWTPLYLAARKGNTKIVKLLLSAGARLNIKTTVGPNSPDRYTALHIAAAIGSLGVVKLLVGAGARVNACNGKSETPLEVAATNGHKKLVRFLKTATTTSNSVK